MKLFLLICGLLFIHNTVSAATLSEDEKEKFVSACEQASDDYIFFEAFQPNREDFKFNTTYQWYPDETKIIKTDHTGATVEAKIKHNFNWTEGGDAGWGTKENKEGSMVVICVFSKVERGRYPLPDFFARLVTSDDYDVWVREAGRNCSYDYEEKDNFISFGKSSITPGGIMWDIRNAYILDLVHLTAAQNRFPNTDYNINKIPC